LAAAAGELLLNNPKVGLAAGVPNELGACIEKGDAGVCAPSIVAATVAFFLPA
jgi:hypothetical protein